jgi:hypothetical protein
MISLAVVVNLALLVHMPAGADAVAMGAPGPQTAPPGTTPLPRNPSEVLQLAQDINGLALPVGKPWHVKLTYDQFDEDGDNVHSGTYEEFYVGPKKYRRIYTGDTLTQTDIATESGLYRLGDQRWPSAVELKVREEALDPLYRAGRNTKDTKPDKLDWQVGAVKLPCVVLRRTGPITISDNGLTKFCFDPGTVMLRYTRGRGWDETTYNNIVVFEGRYIARDVTVTDGGKPSLKIHVEKVEVISHIDESLFAPPSGRASPLGGRIAMTGDVLMDEYGLYERGIGRHGNVTGTVHVKFVVGKDGRVIEADALDGPPELRKDALSAIHEFRFRPVLILGQPVEVESKMVFDVR